MGNTSTRVTRRAGIVSIGTFASRILGLVRESVIAALFPGAVVDAYQTAFMIPNVFRRLTAEGSFSISVVSVFSKIWAKRDPAASRAFVRSVLGFALIFLTVLTWVGMLGAEGFTWLASWGSAGHGEKFALATRLTRWMFPYVLFISLTALAMGLLNATGRFFAPAFAPVFLNLSIIGCAVGLSGAMPSLGLEPIFALAIGVLIGGGLQIALQLSSLRQARLLVLPSLAFGHPGLRRVLRLTGPMVIGTGAYMVGIYVNNSLAWTLPHGSVMYISFANRLVELPLAVVVMAISTASLPSLAALHGQKKIGEMKATYTHGLRLALFVATPAMVAFIALAEPIVAVLYQRGLFGHSETLSTAAGLRFASAGICSAAIVRNTVPVFYALEKVRIPVIMTFVFIFVHIGSGWMLKGPFLHVGLCMALSIAATVQGIGLVAALRKQIGRLGIGGLMLSWLRMLLASGGMAIAVVGVSTLGKWHEGGNSLSNVAVLCLAIVTGVVVYCMFSYLLRSPELKEIANAIRPKRAR
ncbi:MAG: murein biosynthesis integral membrane protein MurJ [Myxococcota bacterium]|nr:murein biosynthesis integral membrane protein MurJ [Myxococcota bacterium]